MSPKLTSVTSELPAGLIEEAKAAFTIGFNGAAAFSAVSITILAVLAARALRHVETLTGSAKRPAGE